MIIVAAPRYHEHLEPAARLGGIARLTRASLLCSERYLAAVASRNSRREIGDSLVAVASTGTMNVRLFDLRGRFVRSWGQRSEGPGEFRSIFTPGGMHIARDSIWVFDFQLQRVNVFSTDGAYGRTIPLSSFQVGRVVVGGVFPDGNLLLRGGESSMKPIQGWQDTEVELFATRGAVAATLGKSYWATQYMARQPARNVQAWGSLNPPGSIQAVIATSDDGFWYADGRRPTIEKRRIPDGRVARTLRITVENPDMDAAALRAAQRAWLVKQDPNWQPRIKDAIEAMEPPPMLPRGAFEILLEERGAVGTPARTLASASSEYGIDMM